MTYAEPERSNEIYNANIAIRDLNKRWHQNMVSKNCPRRVWDFGLKHTTKFIHMIPPAKLNVWTHIEALTGETPDISEHLDFDLYDLVWY